MNYKVVGKFVSQILAVEAAFMLPALIISAACQNLNAVIGFIVSIVIILGIASLLYVLCRKANKRFFAKEGLVSVGIGWIVLSILGCLPFFISREIPSFVDALFETVSGFTTTGASIFTVRGGAQLNINKTKINNNLWCIRGSTICSWYERF